MPSASRDEDLALWGPAVTASVLSLGVGWGPRGVALRSTWDDRACLSPVRSSGLRFAVIVFCPTKTVTLCVCSPGNIGCGLVVRF